MREPPRGVLSVVGAGVVAGFVVGLVAGIVAPVVSVFTPYR